MTDASDEPHNMETNASRDFDRSRTWSFYEEATGSFTLEAGGKRQDGFPG
jgi:hypothetical protein